MYTTFIIGDIHGHYEEIVALLHKDLGLIDTAQAWTGKDAHLYFTGDYVDRGPQGIETIDLIMRLQTEAAAAGGKVNGLLGNHDVMLLAAYRFKGQRRSFRRDWLAYGGQYDDLENMTDDHARWLTDLPTMTLVRDHLLIHADATFYLNYGLSVSAVNKNVRRVLTNHSQAAWTQLLNEFTQRFSFSERDFFGRQRPEAGEKIQQMLSTYGGKKIVHGHTPISAVIDQDPVYVTKPLIYANQRCINVDAGMYRGSPGFAYRLP
jgi:hypothetical protein